MQSLARSAVEFAAKAFARAAMFSLVLVIAIAAYLWLLSLWQGGNALSWGKAVAIGVFISLFGLPLGLLEWAEARSISSKSLARWLAASGVLAAAVPVLYVLSPVLAPEWCARRQLAGASLLLDSALMAGALASVSLLPLRLLRAASKESRAARAVRPGTSPAPKPDA